MSVNVYDPINDKLIPVAGATLFADAPVGSIIAFAGKEINLPEGYLAFNGQTVKRNDYPDLWAFAVANEQVGVDKFFSQGDGSTTFTLADLRGEFLRGAGTNSHSGQGNGGSVGEHQDATEIPNILIAAGNRIIAEDGGGTNNVTNADSFDSSSQQYYSEPLTQDSTNTRQSKYTARPTNTSVVWAVKARQTGLPIDLQQEISKAESYSTTEVRTNKTWIDGKPIYRKVLLASSNFSLGTATWISVPGWSTYPVDFEKLTSFNFPIVYGNRIDISLTQNGFEFQSIKADLSFLEGVPLVIEYTKA